MTRLRLQQGFSLMEVLVVVTILSIVIGVIGLRLGGGPEQEITSEVNRLGSRITALREEAILQGQLYAIEFTDQGYHFLGQDKDNQLAELQGDDVFRQYAFPQDVHVSSLTIDGAISEPPYRLLVDPSGQLPVFELTLGYEQTRWILSYTAGEGIHVEQTG